MQGSCKPDASYLGLIKAGTTAREASNMSIRRRWVALLLGGSAVLAGVLVSVAAAGSSSNGPPQIRVYGGGNVPNGSCTDGATTFCTGVTREFSIFAVHDPNEQITYGTITVGNPERDGGVNSVIRVTCLAVSGNVAEVGGVVVQSPNHPETIGYPYILFFRDSGQPGTVSRDGLSPSFTGPPAGKPTCSSSDASSDAFTYGFFALTYGDIAIQNVTNQNG
jgi:hypothetical protein